MAAKKLKPKFRAYEIFRATIEAAIPCGIRKYYKYACKEKEPKDIDAMVDQILNYILLDLDEVVDFDE